MRIALYQPDIPQNAGTILRLGACLGVPVDIIGPVGFDLSDKALKRAGLDYLEHATLERHVSFDAFLQGRRAADPAMRLCLFSAQALVPYTGWRYRPSDILLFGRESAGVPPQVREAADVTLTIPLIEGRRSLNVAVAAAMATGEALRQTGLFPPARIPSTDP